MLQKHLFWQLKYVLTYLVCVVSLVLHSKMTHTHAFMHINLVRVVDFVDQVHKNVLRNTLVNFTFGRPKIGFCVFDIRIVSIVSSVSAQKLKCLSSARNLHSSAWAGRFQLKLISTSHYQKYIFCQIQMFNSKVLKSITQIT